MLVLFLLACRPDPETDLVLVDPDRSLAATQGVLVTSFFPAGDAFAILVDGEGEIRWSRAADPGDRVVRVTAGGDGTVLMGFNDPKHEERDGLIVRETLDGERLTETVAPTLHHDLVDLGGGTVVYLGHSFGDFDVPDYGVLPVAADTIRVGQEGGGSDVRFDFLTDDYPLAPYWTCPHMELGERMEGFNEWTHSNSLVPTDDGGWLVMSRYTDSIVKLDAAFTFQWQLGGVGGTLETRGEALFQHAHFSDAWDDRILVLDNGWDHQVSTTSRVVEIRVDEVAGTAETVWSYAEPDGKHVGYLGDAKRLPNGNTLVSWGDLNRLDEITPEGDVVWQVALDRTTGRAELWDGDFPE